MQDNSTDFYYRDGIFYSDDHQLRPGNEGDIFYEVIRIMQGAPLFAADHLSRLSSSIEKELSMAIEEGVLHEHLQGFLRQQQLITGNIKLMVWCSDDRQAYSVILYQVRHHYPSVRDYREGVKVVFSGLQRHNPTVKKWNAALREKADSLKACHHAYEVLLANEQGHIVEGSRTNVFFVKGDTFITAPGREVLPGITRAKVITLCRQQGIDITCRSIRYEELAAMDHVFLTGTSPRVLPVKQIDNIPFKVSSPVLQSIMSAYDDMIADEAAAYGK
jgi:branched-chain amino acid aminotransferase